MLAEKQSAESFLKKHGALAADIDFMKCVEDFISEMELGLSGKGSLPMLPTHLSLDNISVKNEKAIVIDAGGTNFRVAVVSFDENGKYFIESFSKHQMPGTDEEISSDVFFERMAELVRPVIHQADKIGFCFSYALEINKNKDGKILFLSKELKVKGGVGMLVGENLLNKLGTPQKRIVMLNDTVAALLAGVAHYHDRRFDSYAGFILGTGTNTAYIEPCSSIKKDSEISAEPGSMIINMESGSFNRIAGGSIDGELDRDTKSPGNCKFEKMVSGAYIGTNLLYALRLAVDEKLFSKEFAEKLKELKAIESASVDQFLNHPYGDGVLQAICTCESEKLLLYFLAENVIDRAAKLAAINIAAAVKKSGAGINPLKPVCIIAEGSTFYKAKGLRDKITYYLRKYMYGKMGLYAELHQAEDATLLGSAIAGLIG